MGCGFCFLNLQAVIMQAEKPQISTKKKLPAISANKVGSKQKVLSLLPGRGPNLLNIPPFLKSAKHKR